MRDILFWIVMITLVFLIVLVAAAVGVPFLVLWVGQLGGIIAASIFYVRRRRRGVAWVKTFNEIAGGNLSPDQLAAHEAELRQRWDAGEHTLELMVPLCHLYLQLKRAQDAEFFGRQACAEFEASQLGNHADMLQRSLRDNAYLGLVEAWMYQGRFAQAARELNDYRLQSALLWNHVTVSTALAFLLADDEASAREVATEIRPFSKREPGFHLRDEYRLMAAYMQHRLLGVDTLAQLDALSKQILTWIDAYRSAVEFPVYQARLREIIEAMAEIVPLGWSRWAGMRMIMHETDALIAENEAKRAAGDDSYQTALVLARAYANHGHGRQAEPLAREAFAAIQAEGWFARDDSNARYLTDIVYGAVHDALMQQGRFGEAADFLLPQVPRSAAGNLYRVFCAWGYFLAEEHDQARQTLDQMLPVEPTQARNLSPRYALLYPYLKFRLGMTESLDELARVQANLADWGEILDLLVDNPYRRAVQAMVEDVRALVGSEPPDATSGVS